MFQISRLAKYAAFGGLIAILWAVVASGAARADVIDVFDLAGSFEGGGSLSGAVSIDVTTGLAIGINAVADGFVIDKLTDQFDASLFSGYLVEGSTSDGAYFLSLVFGVDNLTGYAGGGLSTYTRIADTNLLAAGFEEFLGDGGTATLASSYVLSAPEPSTWALMIVGFAGVGFLAVHRAGRARPATASV